MSAQLQSASHAQSAKTWCLAVAAAGLFGAALFGAQSALGHFSVAKQQTVVGSFAPARDVKVQYQDGAATQAITPDGPLPAAVSAGKVAPLNQR